MMPESTDLNKLLALNDSASIVPLSKPTLSLQSLLSKAVNHHTKHPAPVPVIQIAGANFALEGMISALTGPPKSGKTTVIGYILATCFVHGRPEESLNILSSFAKKRHVIYLDFEQHVSSTQELHDKVLRYAGLDQTPENLHILNLLEFSLDQRREAIVACFNELDVHLIVVDGLADVLTSVNDEEKSNALIDELSILASKHKAAVLVVIHENKGGGSVRGHLGSQIERKCAGLLAVKKDREKKIHSIESRLIRVGDDFENQYFQWSDEDKRMVLCDEETVKDIKEAVDNQKAEILAAAVAQVFGPMLQMPMNNFVAQLAKVENNAGGQRTRERRLEQAVKDGLVRKEGSGKKAVIHRVTEQPAELQAMPTVQPGQEGF